MDKPSQLAAQFRELYNGKWIAGTNFKQQLADLTWKQAITRVDSLNTLAQLAYHVNYYVEGSLNVLKGGALDICDQYSFDLPPIESQNQWDHLLTRMWQVADEFAGALESMPPAKLEEVFVDEKYGNYDRNMHAIIEHCYYHLGQMVLVKKLLLKNKD